MSYTLDDMRQLAEDTLRLAKQRGASASEVQLSISTGQQVSVRMGSTESIEYNRDKDMTLSVYLGQHRGHVSISDFTPTALREAVTRATEIAQYTADDSCCGLAERELMAKQFPDLELYHPWQISVEEALQIASICEQTAFGVSSKVLNSEGVSVSVAEEQFVYGNSHGFNGSMLSSQHSIACSVIAEDNGQMQRDYWYSIARDAKDLLSPEQIGRLAGERSIRRLNPKPIKTCRVPVLFEAPLASSLIGILVSAISGGNLYRKASFLLNSLGTRIASPILNIVEDPYLKKALASGAFDGEGVSTQRRQLLENGILNGYILDSYSARKLDMQTTGNAGGNHNLLVQPSHNAQSLLQLLGTGLLVTEVLGNGVNMVTGDYSQGAAGFWVQDGDIQHPVEGITIAGHMTHMLQNIVAIGDDIIVRGSKQVGSILLAEMTVAAN